MKKSTQIKCLMWAWVAVMGIIPLVRAAHLGEAPEWGLALRLYGDDKARRVGDLLTVLIEEQASVSKEAESQSAKSTSGGGSAAIQSPYIIADGERRATRWDEVGVPSWNWGIESSFAGGGSMQNQDDFTSTMTARVTDVLPNGNLLLEGKRTVRLQEETVEMVLTGVVRPRDISSDNTVASARISDATIRYNATGPLSREQRRGLLTRLLNWVNPF